MKQGFQPQFQLTWKYNPLATPYDFNRLALGQTKLSCHDNYFLKNMLRAIRYPLIQKIYLDNEPHGDNSSKAKWGMLKQLGFHMVTCWPTLYGASCLLITPFSNKCCHRMHVVYVLKLTTNIHKNIKILHGSDINRFVNKSTFVLLFF